MAAIKFRKLETAELERGRADPAKTKSVARSPSEWQSLKDSEVEGLCTLDGEATLRRELRVKSQPP